MITKHRDLELIGDEFVHRNLFHLFDIGDTILRHPTHLTPSITLTPPTTSSFLPIHIHKQNLFCPHPQLSTMTDQLFKSRPVADVVTNKLTPEGVGVTVLRSIGGHNKRYFSPFALLDQFNLEENSLANGIGFHPHPHRGIATFTYILPNEGNGSVKHQDHRGHTGIIKPGDVQYMAGSVVHSEMPGDNKPVAGLQLWINLRKEDKLMPLEYQEYRSDELPVVEKDGITAKVIMGTAMGASAKVKTKTPVHYIHYKLEAGTTVNHPLPPHWNTFFYAFEGTAVTGGKAVKKQQTVFFERGPGAEEAEKVSTNDPNPDVDENEGVSITAGPDGFDFVLISGEPLLDGAPVVHHGPMIMNDQAGIRKAFDDFHNERNGFEGAGKFVRQWKHD